jgi:hypothetical protein
MWSPRSASANYKTSIRAHIQHIKIKIPKIQIGALNRNKYKDIKRTTILIHYWDKVPKR